MERELSEVEKTLLTKIEKGKVFLGEMLPSEIGALGKLKFKGVIVEKDKDSKKKYAILKVVEKFENIEKGKNAL